MNLSQNLKKLRENNKLSQEKLAEKNQYVSKWVLQNRTQS